MMTPTQVQEKLKSLFGGHQKIVLCVEESMNPDYDYFFDSSHHEPFLIDVDKIQKADEGDWYYVDGIFESIISSLNSNINRGVPNDDIYYSSSVKYSFSDTPDWWDVICCDEVPENAIVIMVYGELNN